MKQLANASHAIIALRFVLEFFCTAFIIAWNLCVYSNNIPHTGINEKKGRRFWKETHIVYIYIFRKTNILYRYMLSPRYMFLSGVFSMAIEVSTLNGSFHIHERLCQQSA